MLKVKVNERKEHNIEFTENSGNKGLIDNKPFEFDAIQIKEGSFHVIKDNQSYNIEITKTDFEQKIFSVKVNGNKYNLSVKDKYDELLKSLGLDSLTANKINNIKAPMPGLVLNLLVEEGSVVKKGDSILVLEAMKMENNIKSPTDGVVKKINVKKGIAVEKNQVLISFV